VYSLFSVVEVFVDYILYWVPLYYMLKLVFLVWLMIPKLGGAELVYKVFVEPALRQYRKRIDVAIDDAQDMINKATKDLHHVTHHATRAAGVAAAGLAAAAAKSEVQSEEGEKEE
jgi:receptor expression-enhancing protein 5/6